MNITQKILAACSSVFLIITTYGAGTLSPAGSGLKPAEIISHDVKVTINNGFAQTEVTQQFRNINNSTMEAVYSFPVPQSASLAECQVLVGEKQMEGEVVPKSDADRIYKEETAAGNNAAKADKNGYEDFTFRISNLNPQDTATISFTYYQPLPIDTGVCRYAYPLEEGNTRDSAAESFWTRNSHPTGKTTIRVILRSAWPVAAIRAPYGTPSPAAEDLDAGTADITYELPDGLTRDFIFYYSLADNLPGRLEVVPFKETGKDGTFMMVLTPGIDLQPINQGADYVFVLDYSGSMYGNKIATLAKGVIGSIKKMNPNDRYRIIFFNHEAKDVTNGYIPATQENLSKTIEMLKSVHSGGSTNLYAGLKMALSKMDDDRVTSLIIVTDGVTNTGEVAPAAFAKLMKRQDIRVFGFLMGNSANWPLMRTICNASGGFYDAVSNDDDIIGKILQAKGKILFEAMHDVRVSIKGVQTTDITNQCVKKLYRGQQLVMFGHYTKGGEATVTMETKISGESKTYKCKMDFPEEDTDNPELERLWALAQIEMHEDMVNQGLQPESERADFVRNIGLKYQLVTDETSMIILDADAHRRHSIDRRNQDRVSKERQAQSQRMAAPVKNYRVDVPRQATDTGNTENTQPAHTRKTVQNNMFSDIAHDLSHISLGGGGGALDPWMILIMGGFVAAAVCLPERKKR